MPLHHNDSAQALIEKRGQWILRTVRESYS